MINYDNHVKGRFLANILGKVECILTGIILFLFFCYFGYQVINNIVIKKLMIKNEIDLEWILYAFTAFAFVIVSIYYIIKAIIMIDSYTVSVSIVNEGLKYRYRSLFFIVRIIPWDEFDYITLREEKTKKGIETVIVCRLHDRTRGINPRFWNNVFLYIYPNEVFIKDLNGLNVLFTGLRQKINITL